MFRGNYQLQLFLCMKINPLPSLRQISLNDNFILEPFAWGRMARKGKWFSFTTPSGLVIPIHSVTPCWSSEGGWDKWWTSIQRLRMDPSLFIASKCFITMTSSIEVRHTKQQGTFQILCIDNCNVVNYNIHLYENKPRFCGILSSSAPAHLCSNL